MSLLNQKNIVLALIILLLAGIISGTYLLSHPQIFKSRAYQTTVGVNQCDQPPVLVVSNKDSAQSVFKLAGEAAGYTLSFNEISNEETIIDLNPEQFTELEAKNILQNADIYYLRTLMWLLIDTLNKVAGPSIDPWYALCDHLSEERLREVGAEPTILANGDYLKCADSPPTRSQFTSTDPHAFFTYRKFTATTLVKMVETATLERENKALQFNAGDFALSLIPFWGPILTASAGEYPSLIAQNTLINSLVNIISLPGGPVAAAQGRIISYLAPKLTSKFVVVVDLGKYIARATNNSLANLFGGSQRITLRVMSEEKYVSYVVNPFGARPRAVLERVKDIVSFVPARAMLPGDQDEIVVVAHFSKSLESRNEVLRNGLWNVRGRDTLVFQNSERYWDIADFKGVPPVAFAVQKKMIGYANGDGIMLGGATEDALFSVKGGGKGLAIYNRAIRTDANATLYDKMTQLPILYDPTTGAIVKRASDLGIEPVYLPPEFIYNP